MTNNDINKFIRKYKDKKLKSGEYYGFNIYGLHIHAKLFKVDNVIKGLDLYDIYGHIIVSIYPENIHNIVRISSCSISHSRNPKDMWYLNNYLFDSEE